MDQGELRVLISKTADLMESYQRNSDGMAQRQQVELQAIHALSQQVPGLIRQTAADSMNQLTGQLISHVRAGLEPATSHYEQRLRAGGSEAENVTRALSEQITSLRNVLRIMIWKLIGTVMAALLLLLAGGVWLSMHYTKVIEENRVSAELMKAYNRADMVRCGNGQLCANVGNSSKSQRYGDHHQYAPVTDR